MIRGQWDPDQSLLHINLKELLAIKILLESQEAIPTGESLLVSSDNLATVHCIRNRGSNRSSGMQKIMEEIEEIATERKLTIQAIHLSGSRNVIADALSREGPAPTEWELPQHEFDRICRILDWHPQIDAMATPINRKCNNFISPFPHPQAVGIDFFSIDLSRWRRIYLFPPLNMISKVLMHLRSFKGEVLLITPWWPNQPWFPSIQEKHHRIIRLLCLPQQRIGDQTFLPSKKTCSSWVAWSL